MRRHNACINMPTGPRKALSLSPLCCQSSQQRQILNKCKCVTVTDKDNFIRDLALKFLR